MFKSAVPIALLAATNLTAAGCTGGNDVEVEPTRTLMPGPASAQAVYAEVMHYRHKMTDIEFDRYAATLKGISVTESLGWVTGLTELAWDDLSSAIPRSGVIYELQLALQSRLSSPQAVRLSIPHTLMQPYRLESGLSNGQRIVFTGTIVLVYRLDGKRATICVAASTVALK